MCSNRDHPFTISYNILQYITISYHLLQSEHRCFCLLPSLYFKVLHLQSIFKASRAAEKFPHRSLWRAIFFFPVCPNGRKGGRRGERVHWPYPECAQNARSGGGLAEHRVVPTERPLYHVTHETRETLHNTPSVCKIEKKQRVSQRGKCDSPASPHNLTSHCLANKPRIVHFSH